MNDQHGGQFLARGEFLGQVKIGLLDTAFRQVGHIALDLDVGGKDRRLGIGGQGNRGEEQQGEEQLHGLSKRTK